LIPLLKEIVKINPSIKIIAVPWSAPLWMKSSWNVYGQNLKSDCLAIYAKYFVKYIQGMQAHGIPIYAITPQNEPLNSHNMPSQIMEAAQQLTFIKSHLGPALKAAGLTTKIIIYDHNLDRIDYPTTILSDPDAAQYIVGSAFHQYAGDITALNTMQAKFPTKGLYLTEYWVSAPEDATNDKFNAHLHGRFRMTILNGVNHHCKMALQWNLATDEAYGPHTSTGCSACLGALTISSSGAITRNSGYYTVGHASKFVVPGSVRIGHVETKSGVDVAAFVKPDGDYVILVSNIAGTQTIRFGFGNQRVDAVLPKESISTLVWHRI
jgi:glucosylceramidase